MPKKPPATLLVLPNPYLSLDEHGDPCHVAYRHERGMTAEPIGAVIDRANLPPRVGTPAVLEHQDGPLKWSFATEPVVLSNVPGHRKLIQHRALIAFDEATAKLAGVAFAPPHEVLAAERELAIAHWVALHGERPDFASAPSAAAAPPPPSPPPAAPSPLAESPAAPAAGGV